MVDQPVPLMNARRAEAIVRALALEPARVAVTLHAEERMLERGFNNTDLFKVLNTGSILTKPTRTDKGEWKCKVVCRLRGNRDAGVVTVIARNDLLIVLTMEWEDVR
jgi:hypothetical protein